MKLLRFLAFFFLVVGFSARAELDVAAIKKSVSANVEVLAKTAEDDVHKIADDFKIRDTQSSIVLKEYPRDKHEAFRAEEERRLADRVANNVQHLTADLDSMVEKAFVDILKRQNSFEEAVKKDIAVFKQQFGENITKMLQGKSSTPITYSSSEALAKPVEDLSSRVLDNALMSNEQMKLKVDEKKDLNGSNVVSSENSKKDKKVMPPYQPINVGEVLGDGAKPKIGKKTSAGLTPPSQPAIAAKQTTDQQDILKQIRG